MGWLRHAEIEGGNEDQHKADNHAGKEVWGACTKSSPSVEEIEERKRKGAQNDANSQKRSRRRVN